jgi:uncharacterized RDD family membrane protein YckC
VKIIVKRALAVIIDLIIIFEVGIHLLPWVMLIVLNLNTAVRISPEHIEFPSIVSRILTLFVLIVLWPLLWAALIGGLFKNSLGKMIMGLKVYTNAADKMSMWRGGRRESFRILEVVCTGVAILSFINVVRGYKSITDMIFKTTVLGRKVFASG